ncbi:hypothetical protein LAUMK13_03519 [Mycobacterium innocens]|uniref:Uncharacterized protein n=1 Tax=Mycobacterium innocens TaxID=2341083 RepID=A0A498Q9X2_9MYCO|nr:hypothetical protein LAUMK13_03519 [Mycobacterium innocens]
MRGCSTWTCSRVARASFDRLVSLLDPGIVLRGDLGPGAVRSAHGASAVAALARSHAAPEREVRPATVNGAAVFDSGRPAAVMGFRVCNARIAAIGVLAVPQRIAKLDLAR